MMESVMTVMEIAVVEAKIQAMVEVIPIEL